MTKPEGYSTIIPYIIVNDAAGFIRFMTEVFDAQEMVRRKRDGDAILHAEIKVGDSIIMFADAIGEHAPAPLSIFIYVPDADITFAKAIDHGAKTVMAMSNQPYGRTGGVKDPFGNIWWITTHDRN